MAISSRKYMLSYSLGLYVLSFLSSYSSNWAYECYEKDSYPEDVAVFKSIIFSAAFDVYSFTYLFFRIHSSCNRGEFKQENIVHVAAFIFLTVYGLVAFTRGSEFLNLLMYSCAMGFTVSSATLAILYNFSSLRRISVKTLKDCVKIVLRVRRRRRRRQFAPECII